MFNREKQEMKARTHDAVRDMVIFPQQMTPSLWDEKPVFAP